MNLMNLFSNLHSTVNKAHAGGLAGAGISVYVWPAIADLSVVMALTMSQQVLLQAIVMYVITAFGIWITPNRVAPEPPPPPASVGAMLGIAGTSPLPTEPTPSSDRRAPGGP